jgi:glutaconyl-CoA/methylmalonyl-CoA decarboxylase subunit gamma
MKNYTITVNGNVYDVSVEEVTTVTTPVIEPKVASVAVPEKVIIDSSAGTPKVTGALGIIKVEAGAAGKVFKIEANVGQTLKKGDPVVIIEAMKMEIPVVTPEDGTVASIEVAVGDAIEAGAILATLS